MKRGYRYTETTFVLTSRQPDTGCMVKYSLLQVFVRGWALYAHFTCQSFEADIKSSRDMTVNFHLACRSITVQRVYL